MRTKALHFYEKVFKVIIDEMLYSRDTTIHIYMQKHNDDTIKTSGHSSLEKYTSHFIRKGYERYYCVRGELETEQNCNILTPPTLLAITAFLSSSPGLLNRGPGSPASAGSWFSFQHHFSPTDLNFLSPGLYNYLTSTIASVTIHTQFNPSTVKVIPDIFDRMHMLFTQVHFSSDSPAGSEVNMQQKDIAMD